MPSGTASMPDKSAGDGARVAPRPDRPAGAFAAGAVLLVALLISVAGSYVTYNSVKQAFARHNQYETATIELQVLRQRQLEEDTGLRGYISTGQPVFLEPYDAAQAVYARTFIQLQHTVTTLSISEASPLLVDLSERHDTWVRQVAEPLKQHPTAPDTVTKLE